MKKMYTLRDAKSGVYGQPSFHVNEGSALRSLGDLVNETPANSTPAMHPGDFDLYYLGEWEETTGEFDLQINPAHVINCSNLIKVAE